MSNISGLPAGLTPKLTKPPPPEPRQVLTIPAQNGSQGKNSAWASAALQNEVEIMQSTPVGERNDQLFKSCAAIGEIVAGGSMNEQTAYDALYDAAKWAGMDDKEDGVLTTMKSGFDKGKLSPRYPPKPDAPPDMSTIVDIPTTKNEARPPEPETPPELKDTTPRYTLYSAHDALQPQPPIDWIVQNLFTPGSVALLVGDPKTAKTYSMLDAAVCVAMGKPWIGKDTKQSPVLVIDEESGPRRFARRLGDCLRGHEGSQDTPLYYTTLARFNLLHYEDVIALQGAIDETGARLVIIDALVDVMPGGDENAVKDVQPLFIALRDIASRTNSALVVIHHYNKAGAYRGSSAMHGAVDLLLTIKKKNTHMTFNVESSRDGESERFAAHGFWEPGSFCMVADDLLPEVHVFSEPQSYVLRYLLTHGTCEVQEIMDHASVCAPGTARKALYNLASLELCERTNSGGKGEKAMYALTSKGKSEAKKL